MDVELVPPVPDSQVVVLAEGVSPPFEYSQITMDDHFNQLDELDSQLSQSILPNCGPGGAPPGGESVTVSQIHNSSVNDSNSSLSLDNNISNSSNVSSNSNVSDNNVNCYGSPVVASPGPPSTGDAEMVQASDHRKWVLSESSCEDTPDSFSSTASQTPAITAKSKKPKKGPNSSGSNPANSNLSSSNYTSSKSVSSKSAGSKSVAPRPMGSISVGPKSANPKPAGPRPTGQKSASSRSASPISTGSKSLGSNSASSKSAGSNSTGHLPGNVADAAPLSQSKPFSK